MPDPAEQERLLNEALASGDVGYVAHVLEGIARLRGIQVTLSRDSLPNVLRVMKTLGITLTARLSPPA